MLRAWHNMPVDDFIAQLRTYVIAMGLSSQVVDAVDNLTGVDDLERDHEKDLQETEERIAKEVKDDILTAVDKWLDNYGEMSESQRNSLRNAVENA
jgi:hypothetical protein